MKKTCLAVFFIVPFCVYLYTMHPTVSPYRDSGDLIAAAFTLGIAHPPGYPLYAITGKLFVSEIRLANKGYVMNLMSAFFASAGLSLLALAVLELSGTFFACFAVLFLAFSPAYWRLAQVSEMYSLNAFFAAAIIYFAAKEFHGKAAAEKTAGSGAACFLGFLCGFACANHPTIAFLFPGLLWLVYRSAPLRPRDYLYCAVFFAAGISADLFIMVRASTHPALDWGKPDTVLGFLRAVTRADYGGLKLHPEQSKFSWTAGIIWGHFVVYLKSLISQFTLPAALIGAWGVFLKRKGKFYKFLFVSLVISGPLFIILSNLPPSEKTTLPILEPHLLLPNLIFALFIAAGVRKLMEYGPAAKAVVIALLVVLFSMKLPLCSYREHFYAYDYGKNLLKTAPPGSIIYDPDDATAFIVSYLQVTAGKRPDIKLAAFFRTRWGYELLKERYPDILPRNEITSGRELARVILDFNRAVTPVFAELPSKFPQEYISYPEGILFRLSAKDEFRPSAAMFELYSSHNDLLMNHNYDFFTNQVISYSASARNNVGLSLAKLGRNDEARNEYYAALSIDPSLPAAFNNMGTLDFDLKDYAGAEKWFAALLKLDPESPSAMYNMAVTCKAMKKTAEAGKYLEEAWQKYAYPNAGNELGLGALESGNAAGASSILKNVIEKYPGYLLAYYNLGLSEKTLGNYENSRKCFEIYLNNSTDPEDRKEALSMINSLPPKNRFSR